MRERLKTLVRGALTRTPTWSTPHQWADSDGLYADQDHGWLYCELPLQLLRAEKDGAAPLDRLMEALANQRPNREVHLLMHAWEEACRVPASGAPALDAYLAETAALFVPTRRLLLGVALDGAQTARGGVLESLDGVLGERVPQLSRFDTDRGAVQAVLGRFGAQPASGSARSHLEGWFTLGSSTDVEAIERDDVVFVDETNVIELVAAAAIRRGESASALLAAGRRGAVVASVRGFVRARPDQTGAVSGATAPVAGSLSKVSIVLGRRAETPPAPWAVDLRRVPGLVVRPLPLRQLDALAETLPCGRTRVSPTLGQVRAHTLARVGITESVGVGDDRGLLLGLACPDYSYPCWLDPFAEPGSVTVVTGGEGAGKTFVGESLALQSAHAGHQVAYLAGSAGDGGALRSLVGAVRRTVDGAGALDPWSFLPAAQAAEVAQRVVTGLLPELGPGAELALSTGFRRAAALRARGVAAALDMAQGAEAIQAARTAVAAAGELAPVLQPGPERAASDPVTVATLPARKNPAAAQLADLALALHIGRATLTGRPTTIVVDGFPEVLSGPETALALSAARAAKAPVHLVVTTRATARVAASALFPFVTRKVLLAESSEEGAVAACALAGREPTAARLAWFASAKPVVRGTQVARAALGVHVDARGRSESLLLGPVAADALAALARRRGARYVTGS